LFLRGYTGYLQADALAQYEGLYGAGRVQHCCCRAHARRKFVAAEAGDERARAALGRTGQLYAIERGLPPLLPPADDPAAQLLRRQREEQRRALRRERAEPVPAELRKWLDEHRPQALPKSSSTSAPLGLAGLSAIPSLPVPSSRPRTTLCWGSSPGLWRHVRGGRYRTEKR
jgi:hypothetical protein